MESLHTQRFPGETDECRSARDALLRAELDLRDKLEDVAALPLRAESRRETQQRSIGITRSEVRVVDR